MTTQIKDLNEALDAAATEYLERLKVEQAPWYAKIARIEELLEESGYTDEEVEYFSDDAVEIARIHIDFYKEEDLPAAELALEALISDMDTDRLTNDETHTLMSVLVVYFIQVIPIWLAIPIWINDIQFDKAETN